MCASSGLSCLRMAPTGVAAQNIRGITIDSFVVRAGQDSAYDLVLVDEISMVSSQVIHMLVQQTGLVTNSETRMAFVGDFL